MGKQWKQWQTIFLGSKITVDGDCSHEIKRHLLFGRKAMTNLGSSIKNQKYYFADKSLYSQSYAFSSSHVWMWGMDHKEGQALKNWCFQNVILENTLESRVGCKDIKPVKTTGHQLWIFIGRTDTETEARTLWPLDVKSQLIRKIEGKRRGCQRMR